MSKDNLDDLLRQLRAKPLPSVSRNLQDAVWCEIHARKQNLRFFSFWLDELAALIWKPKFAAGALAAAMVLGATSALLLQNAMIPPQNSMSSALRLDVFSANSRDLSLTVIGRNG